MEEVVPASIIEHPKNNKLLLTLLALGTFIIGLIIGLLIGRNVYISRNLGEQKACTMEAKVCSDGSSVGRSGPSCEFAACPSPTSDQTGNLKTYTGPNFYFKYPNIERLKVFDQGVNTTALKADAQYSVAYEASDVTVLNILVYKSNLTAAEWWNTVGVKKYNQLVTDFYAIDSQSGTPNLPAFTTSQSIIDGQPSLVNKGNIVSPGFGDTIISTISHRGNIYVFEQTNSLPNGESLKMSNLILPTFKFTN